MVDLSWKIRKYLENNSKVYETERNSGNFSIVNLSDGNGDFIETWNVSGVSKPTDDQLNALESEATKLKNNNQVVATRKSLYGTPEEQLEILVEQGVDKLIERNTKIKTDNPKE